MRPAKFWMQAIYMELFQQPVQILLFLETDVASFAKTTVLYEKSQALQTRTKFVKFQQVEARLHALKRFEHSGCGLG